MANELDSKSINHSQFPEWAEFVETPDGDTLVQPRAGFQLPGVTTVAHADEADLAAEAEAAAAGSALRTELDGLLTQIAANGITFEAINLGSFNPTGGLSIGSMSVGSTVLRRLYGMSTVSVSAGLLLPAGGTYRVWYVNCGGFFATPTLTPGSIGGFQYITGAPSEPGGTIIYNNINATANRYFSAFVLVTRIS